VFGKSNHIAMQNPIFVVLVALVVLAGCATTQVETTGSPLAKPICQLEQPPVSTLVLWGPQWRPDQKEPELREAAASRGIRDFLNRVSCIAVTEFKKISWGEQPPSNEELLSTAIASKPEPELVLFVVVRELGPRLVIGIPNIVEGGTEVKIDVRVLKMQTSEFLSNTQTLWRNGGIFVIKGTSTLDRDMSSALSSVLLSNFGGR
jgi:curli biogenesis system outer membrane secretion channel CsgG